MIASAQLLPIAEIGELHPDLYVGLIEDGAVACLKARLEAEGLLTPIWVRRNGNAAKSPWSVIAGRHRLRAAIQLGWTEIAATERADATSDDAELSRLQIAENLDRRTLRPIERACFIMERWREAASSPALAIIAKPDKGQIDVATAAACGLNDRSVRTSRRIHEVIVDGLPDLFAKLNAHPLGESLSAMNRLAAQAPEALRQAADMILARPDWKSMDEVMKAAELCASTGSRFHHTAKAKAAWMQMELFERREHVAWLVENVTPGMAADMIASLKQRFEL